MLYCGSTIVVGYSSILQCSQWQHWTSHTHTHTQLLTVCIILSPSGIVYRLLFERVLEDQIPPHCKKRLNTMDVEALHQIKKGTVLQSQSSQYDKSLSFLDRHYNFDSLRAMSGKMYYNAALKVHQKERDSECCLDWYCVKDMIFTLSLTLTCTHTYTHTHTHTHQNHQHPTLHR